jgi:hypothetical protein
MATTRPTAGPAIVTTDGSPVSCERSDICRNIVSLRPPQAEIHFCMRSNEGVYESIRVESELAADGHEGWRISNLIALIRLHDVTDSAPDFRQAFALLSIAAIRDGGYERQCDTKAQSRCNESHLMCSFPNYRGVNPVVWIGIPLQWSIWRALILVKRGRPICG